jgi:ADP-ribose pyrophosphatase YjhB (NUDIX family)
VAILLRRKPTTPPPTVPNQAGNFVYNWDAIKTDYFRENLDQQRKTPFSFRALATRWHVNYVTVKTKALELNEHGETWNEELLRMSRERTQATITRMRDVRAFDEVEIRSRHITIAKLALSRAIEKIQSVAGTDLTMDQAIKLLQFGTTEERRAAGLPDEFTLTIAPESKQFESPELRDKRYAELRALGMDILSSLKPAPTPMIDVTPTKQPA